MVFVDKCARYRWICGMKTKDQMINVVRSWYSDIADLQTMHKLVVVMSNNAGENKWREIQDFFESKGIQNHFSTSCEHTQNGPAESTINQSPEQSWQSQEEDFGSMADASNVTFKTQIERFI